MTAAYTLPELCLTSDRILSTYARSNKLARQRCREFAQEGINQPLPRKSLNNQIHLGNDEFVKDMQCKLDTEQPLNDRPMIQKQASMKALSYFEERFSES